MDLTGCLDYAAAVAQLAAALDDGDPSVLAGLASDRLAGIVDQLPTWVAWLDFGLAVAPTGSDGLNSADGIRDMGRVGRPIAVVVLVPKTLRADLARSVARAGPVLQDIRLPGRQVDVTVLVEAGERTTPALLVDGLSLADPAAWLARGRDGRP